MEITATDLYNRADAAQRAEFLPAIVDRYMVRAASIGLVVTEAYGDSALVGFKVLQRIHALRLSRTVGAPRPRVLEPANASAELALAELKASLL